MRKAKPYLIPLLSGLLLSPLGFYAGMSQAQEQQPQQQMDQQEAADFDEESLEKFADAYVEVGGIHTEYSQRLQEVEAPEDAQELQKEANDKMVEAIREQGLEVQDYSEIAAALERDPEMRENVVSMIEERQ
ncbi:MAG: DUF4168 domain-containing protein [Aquisalimonadaceae bacterium]